MLSPVRLLYVFFLATFALFNMESLSGQGAFADQVDRAFGSSQELVNGIQFTNQYIRADGHPYWIDGSFRTGSVCINGLWFEQLQLRYNLYSQKLELGYVTSEGYMNQIITVPENISAFFLEGYLFRRLQIGKDLASYYQAFSMDGINFYVRWNKKLLGSESTGSRFDLRGRDYWMQEGENWWNFKNRNGYLAAFPPEKKKALKKLLQQLHYSFQQATPEEMEALFNASILLLEEGGEP